MIQWLQNYSGIKSSGENIEQTELENLRREVKRYKKNEQEDKEMEVSSESEDDISPEEQKK